MPVPYKIYWNTTGIYTAGVMSGSFVELTDDELFDVKITVTRKRDPKSIAIIRTFAEGDFTIKKDNYDLLKVAIAAGLPEIIIRIDRYSVDGAAYVEMWRGTVETRPPQMNDKTKVATISKFKTIDAYSDIEVAYTRTFVYNFTEYLFGTGSVDIEGVAPTENYAATMLYDPFEATSFESIPITGEVISKYYDYINLGTYPGYDTGSGWAFNFQGSQTIANGIWLNGFDTFAGGTDIEATFSISKVIDIYRDMFNLHWFFADGVNPVSSADLDGIQFKSPSELFGIGSTNYVTESLDFAGYSYIDPNYFIRDVFQMSENNIDEDHRTQNYQYDVLSDQENVYIQDDKVTDIVGGKLYGVEKRDVLVMIVTDLNYSTTTGTVSKTSNPYNGSARDVPNHIASLSHRLANYLNDYRQLDSAGFNGSYQAINANVTAPSIEQEPFPIELDLLSDLDFANTFVTSIGNTFAQEVRLDLNSNVIELICQQ